MKPKRQSRLLRSIVLKPLKVCFKTNTSIQINPNFNFTEIKWRHPESNRSFYDSVCKSPDTIHLLNVFNTLTDGE